MKKTIALTIPLLLFIIITAIYSQRIYYASADLQVQKTTEDATVISSFVDDQGSVRFASDKHYATKVTHFEEGLNVLEEYYDVSSNPVTLPAGYSKIQRTYQSGLNTQIIYLDTHSQPVVIKNGYDTIRRSYYTDLLADTDTYYVRDMQVERSEGYWQYKRIYNDEGQVVELQYLDKDGSLTLHKNGYAVVHRFYNDAGKVEWEYYYDTDGKPTTSTLGQYGYYCEYDDEGRTVLRIYTNASGQPMNNNRGYSKVIINYEKVGVKTQYYDVDNNPTTIGRSQFGILKTNGQSIYLDEDGEVMIRLDNILNTHPWIVVVGGLFLTIIAVMLKGKAQIIFLILYILFILYMTMVYRENGDSRGVFELFASYKDFFRNPMTRQNILNNIWLFVPLGAALYDSEQPQRWGVLFWAIGLSIAIEAVQWFTGIGLAEIDDVLSNGLGTLIGYGFAVGLRIN